VYFTITCEQGAQFCDSLIGLAGLHSPGECLDIAFARSQV